jgi:integrase
MLNNSINTYLSMRRILGFKLDTAQKYLASYVRFATIAGDSYVRSQTAVVWAEQAPSENSRALRMDELIRFARFAHADDNRHEIPPNGVFCRRRSRRRPYIFTDDEVLRLVQEARRLGPPGSLRPYTYSTMFGLLAATGLRISEALALHCSDITPDGLMVRETKFRKSRLVCLHDSVVAALSQYLTLRRRVPSNDEHIFVSHRGGHNLGYDIAAETFRVVLNAAGIEVAQGGPRPHLHDLRHRFAIKTLTSCPDSRDRVARHMLALTTYMGHAHVGSTYWYLDSTPQLMTDITKACESFLRGNTP